MVDPDPRPGSDSPTSLAIVIVAAPLTSVPLVWFAPEILGLMSDDPEVVAVVNEHVIVRAEVEPLVAGAEADLAGQIAAARRAGATIREGVAATGIESRGDRVTGVRTSDESTIAVEHSVALLANARVPELVASRFEVTLPVMLFELLRGGSSPELNAAGSVVFCISMSIVMLAVALTFRKRPAD